MKKIFSLFLILCGAAFAQSASVNSIQQLNFSIEDKYYHPKLSEDGTKLLVTSENYKGLWLHDLNTGNTRQINDYFGAGYMPAFLDNENKIIFRKDEYENNRKYSSIIIHDNLLNQERIIEEKSRNISEPQKVNGNNFVYMKDYNLSGISSQNISKISGDAISEPVVYIENSKIILFEKGVKRNLQPLGEGNYIWPSISPDQNKILFTLAGSGTYISDLRGNILANIGYANAPQWSPDGNWIVFMEDRDDGHEILSSEIVMVSIQTGERVEITNTADEIEMYPAWTSGNKIVYHTTDGKVYLVELNID
jgi:tricorn protease-like protein